MADFTLSAGRFVAGDTVTAYAADAFGRATGDAITSGTVATDGTLALSGLTEGSYYVASDGTASVRFLVPVPAATQGGGHVIEDEGTPLTARSKMNFIGDGVTATDNSDADSTDITIPGTTAGTPVTKRVVMPMAGAATNTTTAIRSWAEGFYTILPFAPSRLGVIVMNSGPLSLQTDRITGAIGFDGFWLGAPVFAATGLWGGAKATSTQVIAPFSTPSNGDETAIMWFDSGVTLPKAHELWALTWGASCAAGQTLTTTGVGATGSALAFSTDGTDAHSQASGTADFAAGSLFPSDGFLDVRLVVEFIDATGTSIPVVLAMGDSLTAAHTNDADAVNGIMPHHTWIGAASLRNGFAYINAGQGGLYSSKYADTTNRLLSRFAFGAGTTTPDIVINAVGYNDAFTASATLSQHQSGTLSDLEAAANLGIKRALLATVIPGTLDGTADPLRVSYNAWRALLPYGVEGCFDFAKVIESTSDHTVPDTDYTPAANIHPGPRGYQRMSEIVVIR